MSKTARELYQDFHELYGRAHPDLAKGKAHDEVNLFLSLIYKESRAIRFSFSTDLDFQLYFFELEYLVDL